MKTKDKKYRTSKYIRIYGKTLIAMAEELGVTETTVHRLHKENRLPFAKVNSAPEQIDKRIVRIYQNGWGRCNNPKDNKYRWYGGRGIKFELSYNELIYLWVRDRAIELDAPSLDRIDNNKNYTVDNCKFIHGDLNRRVKKTELSHRLFFEK